MVFIAKTANGPCRLYYVPSEWRILMVDMREVILLLTSTFSLLVFLWLADFNPWAIGGAFAAIVGVVGLAAYLARRSGNGR